LLHVGVWCKAFASQMHVKGSKEMVKGKRSELLGALSTTS